MRTFTSIRGYVPWILLTVFYWTACIWFMPFQFVDLGGDSAQYITLAESFLKGQPFRMINYPSAPVSTLYPPVFPLMLLVPISVLGRNFIAMHFLVALAGFGALIYLYRLFMRYSGLKTAFFIVLYCAFNWAIILYSSAYILSDIPFLFFSAFALYSAARYSQENRMSFVTGIILCLGIMLSYFTRHIGIALGVGILCALARARQPRVLRLKKIIFVFVLFGIVIVLWKIVMARVSAQNYSHLNYFFVIDPYVPEKGLIFDNPWYLVLRIIEGVNYHFTQARDVFFLFISRKWVWARDVSGLCVLMFAFVGFWKKWKENRSCVFHYYFIFYLAIIVMWPYKEGVRFLVPIIPFIAYYCCSGVAFAAGLIFKKWKSRILFIGAGLMISVSLINLVFAWTSMPRSVRDLPPYYRNFMSVHEWLKNNASESAVIMSRKPTITYFLSGRKAIGIPLTLNQDEIKKTIADNSVSIIVLDEFSIETYRYLVPYIHKYWRNLRLIFELGNSKVYEVKK
ncbi:MAG: glycosyltransferase family 39 protein [Candidatus Omnitrophica bacterium]|nr:glycosyltransferase family 39 protein [Candidatus Omnitrophota bacterium]